MAQMTYKSALGVVYSCCLCEIKSSLKLSIGVPSNEYRIAENIGKFSCLDYLEEKTLANGLPIKYGY